MNGRLLVLLVPGQAGLPVTARPYFDQLILSKDHALLPRILHRRSVLLQEKVTTHSDAKAKADPSCRHILSAAERAAQAS